MQETKAQEAQEFYRDFFIRLVRAWQELELEKEAKAEVAKAAKVAKVAEIEAEKVEEVKKVEEVEKVEKIDEKGEAKAEAIAKPIAKPVFVRFIEKIAAPEFAPVITKVPRPGEKERMLETMREFRPEKPQALPSLQAQSPKEAKEEKVIVARELIFGKLNEFVYSEQVDSVQCIEEQNVIIAYKDGRVETKELKLNREELMSIMKRLAEKTKMPLEKEIAVYYEDFFIQGWINEKIKIIIKRVL
ncbi:MAG: hypothetical protein QXJ92_01645 [Candidatus Pacearchaeota archaeon]